MKFDKLIHIYWAKGFLYGGDVHPFETKLKTLCNNFYGLSYYTFNLLKKKIELSYDIKLNPDCDKLEEWQIYIINIHLGLFASVNHSVEEFERATTVRYYLLKTFRGRCLALNKPCHGQRTWSNAKTSKYKPNHIKIFISNFKKTHVKVEVIRKIDFRNIQQKFANTGPKYQKKKKDKKPMNEWL